MRFLIYAEVPACGLNRETLRKLLESHLLCLCVDLAEDVNRKGTKTRTPCAPERIEFKVLP